MALQLLRAQNQGLDIGDVTLDNALWSNMLMFKVDARDSRNYLNGNKTIFTGGTDHYALAFNNTGDFRLIYGDSTNSIDTGYLSSYQFQLNKTYTFLVKRIGNTVTLISRCHDDQTPAEVIHTVDVTAIGSHTFTGMKISRQQTGSDGEGGNATVLSAAYTDKDISLADVDSLATGTDLGWLGITWGSGDRAYDTTGTTTGTFVSQADITGNGNTATAEGDTAPLYVTNPPRYPVFDWPNHAAGFVGDSTTVGQIDSTRLQSPLQFMVDELNSNGVQASFKSIIGENRILDAGVAALETFDPNITVGTDWSQYNNNSTFGGRFFTATASTGTNYLSMAFNSVDRIVMLVPFDSNNLGEFRYRINGGAWVNVAQNGPTDKKILKLDLGITSNANYTIQFDWVSGVAAVMGCVAWTSTDQYVAIQGSFNGLGSSDLIVSLDPWNMINAIDPQVLAFNSLYINAGINDVINTPTPEGDYNTRLTTFLSSSVGTAGSPGHLYGSPLFMNIPNGLNPANVPNDLLYLADDYPLNTGVISTLNTTYGGVLLDSRAGADMSNWTAADAASKMADNIHPNTLGYTAIWDHEAPIIRQTIFSVVEVPGWSKVLYRADDSTLLMNASGLDVIVNKGRLTAPFYETVAGTTDANGRITLADAGFGSVGDTDVNIRIVNASVSESYLFPDQTVIDTGA